jgi:hypothetical protein
MFQMSKEDVLALVIAQPALLAIAPATIKSGLAAFTGGLGRYEEPSACSVGVSSGAACAGRGLLLHWQGALAHARLAVMQLAGWCC